MRKRLVISAMVLGAAAALAGCASESPEPLASPDIVTMTAGPQTTAEIDPKIDNDIDAQQVRDLTKVVGYVSNYEEKYYNDNDSVFDGFADYVKKENYMVAKGNHVSISYAHNSSTGHFLVRVWNPKSPAHKDSASSYGFDPNVEDGWLIVRPYATPKDLKTTVDLTDALSTK